MRDLKPRLGSACSPSPPCPLWHVSSAFQLRDTFGHWVPAGHAATGGLAVVAGRPGRGIDDFFPRL